LKTIAVLFYYLLLERNLLKGKDNDHINAVLAACGFNLRKLFAVFLLLILE
jgi:IS5 family transposase